MNDLGDARSAALPPDVRKVSDLLSSDFVFPLGLCPEYWQASLAIAIGWGVAPTNPASLPEGQRPSARRAAEPRT